MHHSHEVKPMGFQHPRFRDMPTGYLGRRGLEMPRDLIPDGITDQPTQALVRKAHNCRGFRQLVIKQELRRRGA